MMNYILFDDDSWEQLLPLSYTRPVCELRVGILSLREKWEKRLQTKISYITQDYLAEKYPVEISNDNIIINGSVIANDYIAKLIQELEPNEALLYQDDLIAARISEKQFIKLFETDEVDQLKGIDLTDTPIIKINKLTDLFQANNLAIREDFELLSSSVSPSNISATNKVLAKSNIYIHPTARVEHSILNAQKGPIYVGAHAEIMEGSLIRGPVAVCNNSILKMGSIIYGATTIGPYCKVGGELKNVILHSYSNKAHQGYLGDSYIGAWCNLGADTNSSNLKNNYSSVRLWSYPDESYINTSATFCGLFMGDHAKSGINTMFNTGTVVGVAANVFGAGYPPKFIPSFAWGGIENIKTFKIQKAIEMIERVQARKELVFDKIDKTIIHNIFERSAKYRHWKKD